MGVDRANDAYKSLMDEYREKKISPENCNLQFINYKVIDQNNISQYKDYEQEVIQMILEMDEFYDLDMVDVIDIKSGEIVYQFYFFDYGSGSLCKNGTTEEVGAVCQHGFESFNSFETEEEAFQQFKFQVDLHKAYNSFSGKISQFVEFSLPDFFDDFYNKFEYDFEDLDGVKAYLKENDLENLKRKR
ncbi:hypothetical protein JXR93_09170 [bacterium]|nr:hypothetical protein [bacterium]